MDRDLAAKLFYMQGEKLTKALDWFSKAVKMEQENKPTMAEKAMDRAIAMEKEGLEAGESYD
jgi:hypothetical protein